MASTVNIPWGKEVLSINLPENWTLGGVLEPSALPAVPDACAETQRSLAQPVGSPKLHELARAGMKVAIVIDDGSRPTPVASILPAVLDELTRAGVPVNDMCIVPALGVHRAMPLEEMQQRAGTQAIEFVVHDTDDPAVLADLGSTSRGTPVLINKRVAEADLVVSIGCIEPHIIASFGGGLKNLVPGVAGRATIAHNHALNCQPDTFNMVGQPIERNPMRQDLEEAALKINKPIFIINAVLNSSLQVVRVVCGDGIAAHRAGVQVSASIYGVPVKRAADVVIAGSHPMDQDLRQGVKALANNIRAVKRGGVMLTLIRADEGVGVFGLANKKLPVGRAALKVLAPVLLPLVPKLKLKGMGEEDRFFLYFALQAMLHADLFMYGPTIPVEIHERLPFVRFVEKPGDALEYARRKFNDRPLEVLALPHGGSTYPILG